jgi:hypothetical protein
VIAGIEGSAVIERILKHLKQKAANIGATNPHTLLSEWSIRSFADSFI